MKALTTILAERASAKVPASSDGLKVWREAAQPHVREPVVDACTFARPSSYSGNLAARQFGLVGRLALRKAREHRAGGLPEHFVLVVTAEDVVVLTHVVDGRGGPMGSVGDEVARWPRPEVAVTWSVSGATYAVALDPAGDSPQVECQVGRSPLSEDFLNLLSTPARQTPAAG
jgi:hypothetical protein